MQPTVLEDWKARCSIKKIILWWVVVPLLLVFTAPLYSSLSDYNSMTTSNDAGIRADISAVAFSPDNDEAFVNPPFARPEILLLLGIGLVGLAGVRRKDSKNAD
jgi:hypothetical protein